MQQSLSRKVIVYKLADDFEILFAFRAKCAQLLEKEMSSLDLPSTNQWKLVEKYGRSKYKLHE